MFFCPHCSQLSPIMNNIVEPESGVTMMNSIVDNIEQCRQQNIVQSCCHLNKLIISSLNIRGQLYERWIALSIE